MSFIETRLAFEVACQFLLFFDIERNYRNNGFNSETFTNQYAQLKTKKREIEREKGNFCVKFSSVQLLKYFDYFYQINLIGYWESYAALDSSI